MQTIEHTKLKPLSVAMTISTKDRRIIGFRVASLSRKKYGNRPDHRRREFAALYQDIQPRLSELHTIESDECSFTKPVLSRVFPRAKHQQFKGKKGSIAGQGELKKWFAAHSFALRDCCKTPRTRHSSQHYRSLLSVSEDNVGETKRRNRCFVTVPLTTPLPCFGPISIV